MTGDRLIRAQIVTPDEFRGRVTSIDYVLGVAVPRLGNFEAGLVGSLTSPAISAISGAWPPWPEPCSGWPCQRSPGTRPLMLPPTTLPPTTFHAFGDAELDKPDGILVVPRGKWPGGWRWSAESRGAEAEDDGGTHPALSQ